VCTGAAAALGAAEVDLGDGDGVADGASDGGGERGDPPDATAAGGCPPEGTAEDVVHGRGVGEVAALGTASDGTAAAEWREAVSPGADAAGWPAALATSARSEAPVLGSSDDAGAMAGPSRAGISPITARPISQR
jgi:hypothetical protein